MVKSFAEIAQPFAGGASFSISAAQGRLATSNRENTRLQGYQQQLSQLAQNQADNSKIDTTGSVDNGTKQGNAAKKAGNIRKGNANNIIK